MDFSVTGSFVFTHCGVCVKCEGFQMYEAVFEIPVTLLPDTALYFTGQNGKL